MGFQVKGNDGFVVLELVSDGEGGVDLMANGDYVLLTINEDGTICLHDGIANGDVGNLKLAELRNTGWGDDSLGRAAVFYDGEELVRPSKIKQTEPKTKKAK